MGLSVITALEIFSQPDDLQFHVGQAAPDKKWGFAITRGPGHDYKFLVSTEPVYETQEAAARAVEKVLAAVCSSMTAELSNPASLPAAIMNGDNRPLDDANVLSGKYREQIFADLMAKGIADTSTYKAAL